eukprot:1191315-Prorocentrum_minimum.AAC.1
MVIRNSQVVCLTRARATFVPPSVAVTIAGAGMAASMGKSFLYTDRWSAPSTWGGNPPPREGESVVIPFGQHILLDTSPPKLQVGLDLVDFECSDLLRSIDAEPSAHFASQVIIVEGTLVFEDAQDIHLQAEYIIVRNGTLTVGTEASPFMHKANITLYGEKWTPELPIYGNK